MRFCQQCGAELSAGPRPAQPVPTAQPVPAAQPYQAVQQYAGQYGAAQPGAVFPPQAVQPPAQPSRPGESAGKGKKKTALIVGIIIAVLVVANERRSHWELPERCQFHGASPQSGLV